MIYTYIFLCTWGIVPGTTSALVHNVSDVVSYNRRRHMNASRYRCIASITVSCATDCRQILNDFHFQYDFIIYLFIFSSPSSLSVRPFLCVPHIMTPRHTTSIHTYMYNAYVSLQVRTVIYDPTTTGFGGY